MHRGDVERDGLAGESLHEDLKRGGKDHVAEIVQDDGVLGVLVHVSDVQLGRSKNWQRIGQVERGLLNR